MLSNTLHIDFIAIVVPMAETTAEILVAALLFDFLEVPAMTLLVTTLGLHPTFKRADNSAGGEGLAFGLAHFHYTAAVRVTSAHFGEGWRRGAGQSRVAVCARSVAMLKSRRARSVALTPFGPLAENRTRHGHARARFLGVASATHSRALANPSRRSTATTLAARTPGFPGRPLRTIGEQAKQLALIFALAVVSFLESNATAGCAPHACPASVRT